ncbi:signal peptidase II [Gorillibacterium sp. sgz5001074]|uniref:signal peptidase II n=1 Tax=Gorillibacterium sp. sgz5001074 TaxID=3446695 RepID=UPI003F66DA69
MLYFLIAFLALVLDQLSKWYIVHRMDLGESRPVLGTFFQITSHRNTGAAFSILEGQRWFFLTVTSIVAIGIVWYLRRMIRSKKRLLSVALSLVLGGALGNFIDRALFGEVVDFLQFWFRFPFFGTDVDYIFPIFNIADSAIVIGVGLIFLDTLIEWRNEKRGERE